MTVIKWLRNKSLQGRHLYICRDCYTNAELKFTSENSDTQQLQKESERNPDSSDNNDGNIDIQNERFSVEQTETVEVSGNEIFTTATVTEDLQSEIQPQSFLLNTENATNSSTSRSTDTSSAKIESFISDEVYTPVCQSQSTQTETDPHHGRDIDDLVNDVGNALEYQWLVVIGIITKQVD